MTEHKIPKETIQNEIKEIFTPVLEKIPELIKITGICLQKEITEFDHHGSRLLSEQTYLHEVISIIQGKWTLDILHALLANGELHYNELKEILPKISSTMLSDRLKMLEDKKLILRKADTDQRPIRVSYCLSEFGKKFALTMIPAFIYYIMES